MRDEPLVYEVTSATLRRDKALALLDALRETLEKAPENTMFKLRLRVKECIRQKQTKLEKVY